MLQALVRELFSEPLQASAMDPVYHPFVVSILDCSSGSQIPILHIRLRHILFEETMVDFSTLLHEAMILPLMVGEFDLFEIKERVTQFFAEGAEVTMDENLNYYEGVELAGIMGQFDPVIAFTLYRPHTGATRTCVLPSLQRVSEMYEDFRLARLLQ